MTRKIIEDILKKHIVTVNSFVDDTGHNHFSDVVTEILSLFNNMTEEEYIKELKKIGLSNDELRLTLSLGGWYER